MSNFTSGFPYNATWDEEIFYSFEVAEKTCTLPTIFWYADPLPKFGMTFHDLMTILASVATVLCCLICMYLTCGHFFHWTKPQEQKQIVLCIWYLPLFTIINFFALWFYHSYNYITPILDLYNAKGLLAIFLLYVSYVCPDETKREVFHSSLQRQWMNGSVKHGKGSLRWFRIIWVLVFQLVPLQLILFVAYYIVQQTTCPLSDSHKKASIIVEVAQNVVNAIAFIAIYLYYKRVTDQLGEHRPVWKLNAFQGIVALQGIQSLVFTLVAAYGGYFPTQYVSYQDFTDGVPAFMLCWESLIFSLIFIKSFSFSSYRKEVQIYHRQAASVQRAFLDTLNQRDLIDGTVMMFTILFNCVGRRDQRANVLSKDKSFAESVQLHDTERTDVQASNTSHCTPTVTFGSSNLSVPNADDLLSAYPQDVGHDV